MTETAARHLPDAPPDTAVQACARGEHIQPSFAAIDLGTNNCRLLVAAPTSAGFHGTCPALAKRSVPPVTTATLQHRATIGRMRKSVPASASSAL